MKKTALFLFAAIAVIAIGAGTARADRGFWNYNTALETYVNVINMDQTTAQIATVTFYSSAGGTALGATSQTIQPNGRWAFPVSAAGTPTTTVLTTGGGVGTVVITGPTSGGTRSLIHGYTTVATSGLSGFNFYFQAGLDAAAE